MWLINLAAHIGDSGNDLNALPEIGTFIAMENAMDEVKEVAHYIGPSFENSGIAKLFKDLKEI
ncbi:COF family HAD hydrolase protein (plasmid) [Mycoplasmopsis fermentans]|nr:COF family HAD hydrolase protein [Mycoplasmopsis fermentans]